MTSDEYLKNIENIELHMLAHLMVCKQYIVLNHVLSEKNCIIPQAISHKDFLQNFLQHFPQNFSQNFLQHFPQMACIFSKFPARFPAEFPAGFPTKNAFLKPILN